MIGKLLCLLGLHRARWDFQRGKTPGWGDENIVCTRCEARKDWGVGPWHKKQETKA